MVDSPFAAKYIIIKKHLGEEYAFIHSFIYIPWISTDIELVLLLT
jgi:hypothetical protein